MTRREGSAQLDVEWAEGDDAGETETDVQAEVEAEEEAPPQAAAAPAEAGPEELDAVREILFGQHFAALESRVEALGRQLEQHFDHELGELRRQLDADLESLGKRVDSEQQERRTLGEALVTRIGDLDSQLGARIAEVRTQTDSDHRKLREQLLSQSNLLSDAVRQTNEEIQQRVSSGLRELEGNKADRRTLSTLLADVAKRLQDEGQ